MENGKVFTAITIIKHLRYVRLSTTFTAYFFLPMMLYRLRDCTMHMLFITVFTAASVRSQAVDNSKIFKFYELLCKNEDFILFSNSE